MRWCLCAVLPVTLVAQVRPAGSPLDPIAHLTIPIVNTVAIPRLFEPIVPVGLFHALGLAAGLVDDVERSRGSIRAHVGGEGGTFRRPFDPDDVSRRGAEAGGWRRLSARRAVWGRAAVQDAGFGNAGHATFTDPYGSSPLVIADTTAPRLRRAAALLEGMIGWRLGGARLGLGAGLDVREDATRDARFVRTARHANPALQVSLGHALPLGLQLVAIGRWSGASETAIFRTEPGSSRAYQFDGFDEPFPRDLAPPSAYLRRNQRDAYALGGALAGGLLGGRFVMGWSRTYRADRHFSLLVNDPPSDTWDADGWTGRAGYHRLILGVAMTLTLHADRLTGDVTRQDIDGVITRVRDTGMGLDLQARWQSARPAWDVGVSFGVDRRRRQVNDFLVRVASDLDVWYPRAAVAVAWTRGSTSFLLGAGVTGSGAYATLPNPTSMGPLYQTYVAPALSRDATRSITIGAMVGVRRRVTELLSFELTPTWQRTGVRGSPAPFGPDGAYTRWAIGAGVVVGR
ncbi:MAG: DUF6850 family outer membrane beta-barrel protein [Gemmatimonadales bacterium]